MVPVHANGCRLRAWVLTAALLAFGSTAFAHGGGGHGGGGHGGGRGGGGGGHVTSRGGGGTGSHSFGGNGGREGWTSGSANIPTGPPFYPDELPEARLRQFLITHMPHLFGGLQP